MNYNTQIKKVKTAQITIRKILKHCRKSLTSFSYFDASCCKAAPTLRALAEPWIMKQKTVKLYFSFQFLVLYVYYGLSVS